EYLFYIYSITGYLIINWEMDQANGGNPVTDLFSLVTMFSFLFFLFFHFFARLLFFFLNLHPSTPIHLSLHPHHLLPARPLPLPLPPHHQMSHCHPQQLPPSSPALRHPLRPPSPASDQQKSGAPPHWSTCPTPEPLPYCPPPPAGSSPLGRARTWSRRPCPRRACARPPCWACCPARSTA
ncbi:hypothetical protein T310_9795, partial [Rasamsonia emersonii CBS 393.64]